MVNGTTYLLIILVVLYILVHLSTLASILYMMKMELKSSTLRLGRFLRIDRRRPKGGKTLSALESLPVELLQSITCHLPISSASSFALCSKYICYVVGLQYWHHLKSQPLQKKEFLLLLEQALPRHWLCHYCYLFHCTPRRRWFMGEKRVINGLHDWYPRGAQCAFDRYRTTFTFTPSSNPFSIRCTHVMVQLAMNRHRFGFRHGVSLDVFNQTRETWAGGYRGRSSTDARIVADELYLRSKYWVVVSFSNSNDGIINPVPFIDFCSHKSADLDELSSQIRDCMLAFRDKSECSEDRKILRGHCDCCLTEYEFCISSARAMNRVLLEYTAWKKFGPGRDPEDPKWKLHTLHGMPFQRLNLSPGSIRSGFEAHEQTKPELPYTETLFVRLLGLNKLPCLLK